MNNLKPALSLFAEQFSACNLEYSKDFWALSKIKMIDSRTCFDICLSFLKCIRDKPYCLKEIGVIELDIINFFELLMNFAEDVAYRNSSQFILSQILRVLGDNQKANNICVKLSSESNVLPNIAPTIAYTLRTSGFYHESLFLLDYLKLNPSIHLNCLCALLSELVYTYHGQMNL